MGTMLMNGALEIEIYMDAEVFEGSTYTTTHRKVRARLVEVASGREAHFTWILKRDGRFHRFGGMSLGDRSECFLSPEVLEAVQTFAATEHALRRAA